MASYLSSPDPGSYSMQPYQLPYQQIMQTVGAKTSYFLQGAAQLRSAYQQAAGLDLSLDQNRQALGNFTEQANQQINQAAKSDLSQADNISSAMNIFKPLYDGTSELSQQIMGDHAVTTMARQIQSQYAEAKTHNNGKEYSADNESDSLNSYQKFVQNQDPNGWKAAYQGLKQYQPYYDYHKELSDNAKGCHANSNTTTGVNGMYIVSDTQSGVDASRMYGCLGSNLSSQAENQIALEGRVRFGQNYHALGDAYLGTALQEKTSLLQQRAELAVHMANPKLDPTTKQGIAAQIKALDSQVDNIKKGTDAIQSGDLSYIKNNYDTLAASAYRTGKLGDMAGALSYMDESKKITADPAKMMYARFGEDERLLGAKQRFEDRMDDKKFQHEKDLIDYKLTAGSGGMTPVSPTVDPDQAPEITRAQHEADKTATAKGLQDYNQKMDGYMATNPGFKDLVPKGSPQTNPVEWNTFRQGVLDNPDIIKAYPYLQNLKGQMDRLQVHQKALLSVDEAVATDPRILAADKAITGVRAGITQPETVRLSTYNSESGGYYAPQGAINLSAQDKQDLIQGKTVRGMTLEHEQHLFQGPSMGIGGGSSSLSTENVLNINGRKYSIGGSDLDNVIAKRDEAMKNYSNVINSVYQERKVSDPTWGNISNDKSRETLQAKANIESTLAPFLTNATDKEVKMNTTDFNGSVQFSIAADSKGNYPKASDMQANWGKSSSGGIITEVPGTTGRYQVTGIPQFQRGSDISFISQIQTIATNQQKAALNEGDAFKPTPLFKNFHGIDITTLPPTDPGGTAVFQVTDKDDPSRNNILYSPSEVSAFMKSVEQRSK